MSPGSVINPSETRGGASAPVVACQEKKQEEDSSEEKTANVVGTSMLHALQQEVTTPISITLAKGKFSSNVYVPVIVTWETVRLSAVFKQ